MKLGVGHTMFPPDWPLEKIFGEAAEIGFDGVELWLTEDGAVSLTSTREDMERVKELARKHGIELYSLASGLYWQYSLTDEDSAVREKAKGIVRKQLELAHALGCDTILVVPGCVGADFLPESKVVDYEAAYARAAEWLWELKPYAEELQVSIGIENVWNKFLLSPLEMRDLIDRADSRYVGAYLDIGNVLNFGYPQQWVRILGKRICKVHLKDFSREVGNLNGFVELLEGDVDYPAVMSALREAQYDGWLTAELVFPPEKALDGIRRTMEAMRRIVHV